MGVLVVDSEVNAKLEEDDVTMLRVKHTAGQRRTRLGSAWQAAQWSYHCEAIHYN
jgi:hypothetical protein